MKSIFLKLLIVAFVLIGPGASAWDGPTIGGGGGVGDVIGPLSGTDECFARFDGDGQHLQDSGVCADDSNNVTGATSLDMEGPVKWSAGAAVTGSNYSIQRDLDATNQLHLNVPTGSGFELSVNDAAQFTLSATAANFQDNDIQSSGRVAIGNDAVFSNDRYVDFSRTITTFPTGQDYGFFTRMTLDPSATVGTGSESFVSHEYYTEIPAGNTQNWNLANFSNAEYFFYNFGDGDIGAYIALWGGANHYGTGDIAFEQVGGYFTAYNNGVGTIPGTTAKAGNFAIAAGTGNFGAGSIARDYTFYAESPYLTGGSIAKHWGFYMEDQEIGTESWAIQTTGGKVEFGAPIGKDLNLRLTDNDVTQPYSSFFTNSWLDMRPTSSTVGGATLTGLSDGDGTPFTIRGVIGTGSQTTATAAFKFVGAEANGSGGIQNVGNGDLLFEFINNTLTSTPAFMCTGGRLCGYSTEFPNARLDISSNGSDSSTQSFQVTDSGSGNPIFRIRNDAHATVGATATGQTAYLNVNGGNSAGNSSESINVNLPMAAFNGSDNATGIEINITGTPNHTGASNTIYGINIAGINFDADQSSSAINIGSGGWNYAMSMPSGVGLRFGTIDVADSSGSLSIASPLIVSGAGESTFSSSINMTIGSGWGQFTAAGSTGGCLMIRDTDNGGWTQCDALDGTLTCSADDGDGLCD